MLSTSIPAKIAKAFAWNAPAGTAIQTVPATSTTVGAAAFDTGFPPVTFEPVGSGGVPPDGRDVNGLFNLLTNWISFISAGNALYWDSAFSTAIGGYPKGARVLSNTFNTEWLSTIENNTANPDTVPTPAGWVGSPLGYTAVQQGAGIAQTSSVKLWLGYDGQYPRLTMAPISATDNTIGAQSDIGQIATIVSATALALSAQNNSEIYSNNNFLNLKGGTVTGQLIVSGAAGFNGGLTSTYLGSTGTLQVNGDGTVQGLLNMGSLGVFGSGQINGNLNVSGNINSGATITASFVRSTSAYLNLGGNAVQITRADGSALGNLSAEAATLPDHVTVLRQFIGGNTGAWYLPGYGGNMVMQHGNIVVPGNNVATSFTFPSAFPSAPLGIVISYNAFGPPPTGAVGAQVSSNSAFTATNTATASSGCTYWAWGY